MKRGLKAILPILLIILIIASLLWYLMIYDPGFTKDFLLGQARGFESRGEHKIAEWLYGLAYNQATDGAEVAIELAEYYIENDNYTKAEYTLSNAIADGATVDLYIALCKTYVEQDKLLDAVNMLNNIADPVMKAQLDELRPAAPTATPDPNFYNQYITVSVTAENGDLYISTDGEYPSITTEPFTGTYTLPGGVTIINALAVDENKLVSPLSVFGYTINGVIEPVEFQDFTLEEYIRTMLSIGGRTIYSDDLWAVTDIVIPEGCQSLEDLVHFPYLKTLKIADAGKMDLTVLSSLNELTELTIEKGTIDRKGLEAIGTLHELTKLTLRNCGLTSVTYFNDLTKIEVLDLSGNTLRNIDVFSNMTGLRELYMKGNSLTDLTAISKLKKITVLDVEQNALLSLSPVFGLPEIHTLLAGGNAIRTIDGIGAMVKLEKLNLSTNFLTNVTPLAGCLALTELDLSNNTIEDIAFLSAHQKLVRLHVSHNMITALPAFERNCAISYLDASYNLLTEIEVLSVPINLNIVKLDYNEELEDLEPLSLSYRLMQVDCYGTKVSEVTFLTDRSVVVNFDPTAAFD